MSEIGNSQNAFTVLENVRTRLYSAMNSGRLMTRKLAGSRPEKVASTPANAPAEFSLVNIANDLYSMATELETELKMQNMIIGGEDLAGSLQAQATIPPAIGRPLR